MQVLDSVLLVDDDRIANNFHKGLFNKLGLAKEIVEKRDGKSALDYIADSYHSSRQLPSLVLVDLAMPVMSGYDLIREIQNSVLLSVLTYNQIASRCSR